METRPTVDVIVPCYNYGAYVESCVASIFANAGVDIRILLIDDGSTDNTPDVGTWLAAADARVTYRRHPRNLGHIATYNEGLAWVAADYVLLISADDLLAPGALRRAANAFASYPNAAFVHGRQVHFSTQPPDVPADTECADYAAIPASGEAFIASVCAQGHNPVATPTVVVRASAQAAVGGYEPTLPHTADLELWLRLAAVGDAVLLDGVQAFKRCHAHNMQLGYVQAAEGDVFERRKAFDQFFNGPGRQFSQTEIWRQHAYQFLAGELVNRAAVAFDALDGATTDRLMQSAATLLPEVRGTRPWRRMVIKRALGTSVWDVMRSLIARRDGHP
jgi:glycosyltransferase involved in cell wall biosynthesis